MRPSCFYTVDHLVMLAAEQVVLQQIHESRVVCLDQTRRGFGHVVLHVVLFQRYVWDGWSFLNASKQSILIAWQFYVFALTMVAVTSAIITLIVSVVIALAATSAVTARTPSLTFFPTSVFPYTSKYAYSLYFRTSSASSVACIGQPVLCCNCFHEFI